RRAAFRASAVQELVSSLDMQRAVSTLAKLFVPNLAESVTIDINEPDGTLCRRAVAHRDETIERKMQSQVGGTVPPPEQPREQPSGMFVALIIRGQLLGLMTSTAPPGYVFTRDHRQLANELGRHGSLAIGTCRRYLESEP